MAGDELTLFDRIFALGQVPAFPGHKHPDGGVLYMRQPIAELSAELGVPYRQLRASADGISCGS